jgi:hypothetical protein
MVAEATGQVGKVRLTVVTRCVSKDEETLTFFLADAAGYESCTRLTASRKKSLLTRTIEV